MVLEARLGEQLGVTRPGTAREIDAALRAVGLPVRAGGAVDADRILPFLERDKKARGGSPRFVFLTELGVADPAYGWSRPVGLDDVRRVL
jgi:3-dehydroquinate synthetase